MGDVSLGQRLAFGQDSEPARFSRYFPNDEKFRRGEERSQWRSTESSARRSTEPWRSGFVRHIFDSHMGSLFTTPELIATYVKVAHDYHLPFLAVKGSPLAAPQAGISTQDVLLDGVIIAGPEVPRDQWKEFYLKSIAGLKPGLPR